MDEFHGLNSEIFAFAWSFVQDKMKYLSGTLASNVRVLLGEHNIADSDFNRVDVAEIINHPDYNSWTIDNDYAILRLKIPVNFTNEVSPACLPADLSNTYAGVLATVTGWGTLSSGGSQPTVLQEVDVTVTTNTVCNNAYGSITANMICAADSGRIPARETLVDP